THFGGYQNLNGLSSEVLINYRSDLPGQRVTLNQVLQGSINRNFVKDRVVLVGITAPIGRDTLNTPYGKVAGVWIHAHMVSQMLSAVLDRRPLIWTLPQWRGWQWGDLLWVFVWSSLGSLLAGRIRPLWLLGFMNVVVAFVLYQVCLAILIQGGWMPLIPSLLSLLLTSGVTKALLTDVRR
ncbi:MAG TPA: CHASE2 domain-containing protein, partial [Candidatus Obscuribacterales bacterium]